MSAGVKLADPGWRQVLPGHVSVAGSGVADARRSDKRGVGPLASTVAEAADAALVVFMLIARSFSFLPELSMTFNLASAVDDLRQLVARADALAHASDDLIEQASTRSHQGLAEKARVRACSCRPSR